MREAKIRETGEVLGFYSSVEDLLEELKVRFFLDVTDNVEWNGNHTVVTRTGGVERTVDLVEIK